ncbi:hypothetical protein TTHERM_00486350 (macronuclear) [Tetrahymena thermophila SB210]|uniref:Uncharacterized protein n=1 Tax=Tetrahymena thermophila (strain SB210) TaxID=312017 RepID=I7LZZ3_TETTS|nr:hypothetical protein TTHERM_00486350 [Tetrahymena thermophila SB210]EAR85184.2 hypothetical protein TTHERM_00486350 [Tetrahymena thermophila SB210]|eukprot:XP_001032847.2 hypothetical protein TTHERM_00486350 [Tetrahymena thermophila SB210]
MNASYNKSKDINSKYKGHVVEQKYNDSIIQNQNLEPKKLFPSYQEQSEQFYEESDQNLNDENPLTEQDDTSFEENNASFLKTFKYKKQSNEQQNDKIISSDELQSDDQYAKNKNSQQSDQSHMMSNYIEQLKKERNQVGYKNKFDKKKIGNQQRSFQNNQQNSQNIEKKAQNAEGFREDQLLKEDNLFTIKNHDQKSNQIGTVYLNSGKSNTLNKNNGQFQYNQLQNQTNGQRFFQKQIENQIQQVYQNKSDLSNQQYAISKNLERTFNNQQYIHEERSSDECKSSSSSANYEKSKSQQKNKYNMQQLDNKLDQNLISTQEDNYFTLKDSTNLINTVDINTETDVNKNDNIQINLKNTFQQIPSKKNDQQKNNLPVFNTVEQTISSSNQSQNLCNDQQLTPIIQSNQISNINQINFTNKKQNQNNGRQNDHQLTKSKSQIQFTNNNFNSNEIQDKQYDLQSPLSQLNLFKHSVKANQKSNFQNNNNFSTDTKNIINDEKLLNQDTQGKTYEKSQRQLQALNNDNQISFQNIQQNQQNSQVKESLFGNLNNFQIEFFQKIQCAQIQQYELICDKENKFYQERKKSLEKKYEQMSNINLQQKEGASSQQIKKENCLQIIAERLMLELRMANKIISFLDCQNKYFQKRLEDISRSTISDEKKYLTLSQFVCNNCQSTSFLEKEDNLTFIKNAKVSQLSSSCSNQNHNFSQVEQNAHFVNQNSDLIQKINNLNISQQSYQQSQQQQSSLQDDFKNIVSEFNNLKKLSINLQKQIELLQKENQQIILKNNSLMESIMQKEQMIQKTVIQHEQDKKNLIQEINMLTKENCDIRDNFQEQIKQIKLHEAQEFHNLEEKVRQTILKKDDCIQKLNQIIYELRAQ